MRKLSPVGRRIRRPLTTIREVPGEVREVEKIVYVDREVPVEKIVYVDRPDPEVFDEPEAKFKFTIGALQDERKPDESLEEADIRLEAELLDLEARLGTVSPDGLDRHTDLSSKLFRKRGA